ncbi:MAG: Beta-hexosaminidase [Myxococcaceae bacterium]|nr:Beta-hexosaminidase [Myxococcaceae bacterium]
MSRLRATLAIAGTTGNRGPSCDRRSSSARHPSHVCQVPGGWHVRPLAAALVVIGACGIAAGCTHDGRPPATSRGAGTATGDGGAPGRALDGATFGIPDASAARPPLAPALALVPRPRNAVTCSGSLSVGDVNGIVVDDDPAARAIGTRLAQWLGIGASLVRAIPVGAPGPSHAIVLRLDAASATSGPARDAAAEPPRDLEDEAYTLDVTPESAVLRARHPAGLFYAAQSLAQLAGSRPLFPAVTRASARSLPCIHVDDAPAQRVRAMHLDVARHFFSTELVERYVDILAFYRFNVFHWHLTDDQGFRLSIRSHPELTQVGARRIEDGHEVSGSYTQDDARAVVARARDSFVTVVPEIEMPGHARAILASHPELSCTGKKQEVPSTWGVFDDVLCAGNDATYKLLDDVLRETTEVFPSRLVHVGGDEVPKTRWTACPKCRARMAREKLDTEQLHGAFLKRVGAMLATRGRRMVAWDDALEGGLPQDAVVVAWQSAERARLAVAGGRDVVMAPSDSVYLNFWQSRAVGQPGHEGYLPWTKVLAFEPPTGSHVLGGEGALWTEYVRTSDELDTQLLPRLAALSEALWSGSGDATSFAGRFTAQRPLLDANGVRYFVEPPIGLRAKKVFVDTAVLELARPAIHPDGVVRFTLDGTEPTAGSPIYDAPIVLRATTSATARLFLPGGRTSDVVRGTFERSALHPPIQPSMDPAHLREGVLYKYFEGDFRTLPNFATLAPARSGRLSSLGFDPSFRAERFAVAYDAWLRVPADGVVRFVTHADDGVAVDVDGVRVLVDDGEHAARDADGEIALERGPHTVRLLYFQGGGGKELSLQCEGPGLPLGRCPLVSP